MPNSLPIEMGFKDYIDEINNTNNSKSRKLYMPQMQVNKYLPELVNNIEIDKYIPSTLIESINLWVGPGGNTTPFHYDRSNNFFIQLYGNKKMWICNPMQFYKLYPNSCFSKATHISQVNAADPDLLKYPKLLTAKFVEINIPAGTLLFLPSYWWHQVYSIHTVISINIWCKTSLFQKFVPAKSHGALFRFFNFFNWSSKKS